MSRFAKGVTQSRILLGFTDHKENAVLDILPREFDPHKFFDFEGEKL